MTPTSSNISLLTATTHPGLSSDSLIHKKGPSLPSSPHPKDFEASFGMLSSAFGFGGMSAPAKLPRRDTGKNVKHNDVPKKNDK
ncbi:hypothetical protein QCA50_016200 [Cerrena zonata]|uniref:Uncharacterized protein n=1 Tax=Cerrena zonata TaxID=2478898 RepID=A0AAW0FW05_9APHY